ncbi:MAG: hypothetical protein JXB62_00920 [Pirellulales bacterium]|nr:hypothetical protein [Pirellulales bacterium]
MNSVTVSGGFGYYQNAVRACVADKWGQVPMKNEVWAKLVCHNICCLIQAMHEVGVNPTLWAEQPVAQELSMNQGLLMFAS